MSPRLFVQAMGSWHAPERYMHHMVKSKIQDKAAPGVASRKTPRVTDAVQQAVPAFVRHTHAGGGVLHEYGYLPLSVSQVNCLEMPPCLHASNSSCYPCKCLNLKTTQSTSAVSPLLPLSSLPAPASCARELTERVSGAHHQRPLRPVNPPSAPALHSSEPWHAERDNGGEEQERMQRGRQPQALAPNTASAPDTHAGSGLPAGLDLRQRRGAPQSTDKSYKGGKSLTLGAKQARDDQQYAEQAAAIKALMPKGPVVAGAGLRGLSGLVQRQAALTIVAAKIKRLERDLDERDLDQAPNPSLSSASSAHA